MTPSTGGTIAIVGAGLGGLTAALALLRQGRRVRVYEQAPALGEVGAGISVSAGAGLALASLGLGPELLAASLPVPAVAFAHYRTGELLAGAFDGGAPRDRGFETARHMHRADLHRILCEAVLRLDADAVQLGSKVEAVESSPDAVSLRFADGTRVTAVLVIGADGTRSTIRRLLFDKSPPTFAGQVAFRCLIPRDRAAPFLHRGNAVVSVGASRIFHRYLVRAGSLVNVIGIVRSEAWRGEGWNTPATIDEFLGAFEGFHDDVRGLIASAPRDSLIKWALFVRPPLSCWHSDRIGLLGDAAHPILPFLGLGAALAIEDGIVLARAIALHGEADGVALAAFQAVRMGRVDHVRLQSILQGEIVQSTDPDTTGLQRSPSQDARLFDHDPCAVPFPVQAHA